MKTGSITKLSKEVEFTTNKESFEFRMKFLGYQPEHIKILWKVYKLIHLTDYAPERIREVFGKNMRYSDVAEKFERSEGTIKKEVHEFSKTLQQIWRGDVYEMIKERQEMSEEELEETKNKFEEYISQLEAIIDDSIKSSNILIENIEDKFSVPILDGINLNQTFTDVGQEDFLNLRGKLVHFSIESQKFIMSNMDKKLQSYGVYLLTTPESNLSEQDKERRKEIIAFTKIKQ